MPYFENYVYNNVTKILMQLCTSVKHGDSREFLSAFLKYRHMADYADIGIIDLLLTKCSKVGYQRNMNGKRYQKQLATDIEDNMQRDLVNLAKRGFEVLQSII